MHTIASLPSVETPELDALRGAEVNLARELQREGTLVALWRESGRLASFGIWRGSDADDVHSQVATLPLFHYMTVTVTEIERHPNAHGSFPFNEPSGSMSS